LLHWPLQNQAVLQGPFFTVKNRPNTHAGKPAFLSPQPSGNYSTYYTRPRACPLNRPTGLPGRTFKPSVPFNRLEPGLETPPGQVPRHLVPPGRSPEAGSPGSGFGVRVLGLDPRGGKPEGGSPGSGFGVRVLGGGSLGRKQIPGKGTETRVPAFAPALA